MLLTVITGGSVLLLPPLLLEQPRPPPPLLLLLLHSGGVLDVAVAVNELRVGVGQVPAQALVMFVLLAAILPRTLEHLVAVGLRWLGITLRSHSVRGSIITLVTIVPGITGGLVTLTASPLSLLVLLTVIRTTFSLPRILGRTRGRGKIKLITSTASVILRLLPLPLGLARPQVLPRLEVRRCQRVSVPLGSALGARLRGICEPGNNMMLLLGQTYLL